MNLLLKEPKAKCRPNLNGVVGSINHAIIDGIESKASRDCLVSILTVNQVNGCCEKDIVAKHADRVVVNAELCRLCLHEIPDGFNTVPLLNDVIDRLWIIRIVSKLIRKVE